MITKSQPGSTQTYTSCVVNSLAWYYLTSRIPTGADPTFDWILENSIQDAEGKAQSKTFSSGGSTITYDCGNNKMNYCEHIRNVHLDAPVGFDSSKIYGAIFCQYPARYANFVWYGGVGPNSDSIRDYVSSSSPTGSIPSDYRTRAWYGLLPELNDGFSLANFIIELPELPELMKQLWKISTLIKGRDWKKLLGSKSLAEMHLMNSFGIQPLADDLYALVTDIIEFKKRIHDFRERGKEVHPYHYREFSVDKNVLNTSWAGRIVRETSVQYASTMRASYVYDKLTSLEGFARYAGLIITPEVIWNAIPGSFLLDWVIRVGDALHNLGADPHLRVNVNDYCDSVKVTESTYEEVHTSGTCFVNTNPWNYYLADQAGLGMKLFEAKKSFYLRVPNSPQTGEIAFPVFDSLSARELVLGGALLRTFQRS